MSNLTKLFISSVAQDSLTPLRSRTFDEFIALGHQPEMYERTFGPWPMDISGVEHCLNKVRESDIFCLFIHNKGGSMTGSGYSVTHREFLTALNSNKVLLLYAEPTVSRRYFSSVRRMMYLYIEQFRKTNGRDPSNRELMDYLELASETNAAEVPSKYEVDVYVWVMLYDIIEKHGKYLLDMPVGIGLDWKPILSAILKEGAYYFPRKSEYLESIDALAAVGEFSEFVQKLAKEHLNITAIQHPRLMLARLQAVIKGAEIKQLANGDLTLGKVKNCSAICLFQHNNDYLDSIYSVGDTAGGFHFPVDKHKYVTHTYRTQPARVPVLYYTEDKRMFYLLFKIGEYVISYHFPEETKWHQNLYVDYSEDIKSGILMAHSNVMIFEFMNSILRGLQK
ncbi:DUF4062 domain-containing protein [Paenibacillus glycanilyticus]|uniref:DUF4062 domain-containing protein n=1 Tax=Paenibacillus glycanilyticus TaxID=126569 RepID=UPI0020417E0D|nr:DUF4062 domain-containing protein [Paenibacillus glycanilyticus]MCM3627504.1 DUF4062 domain-containing protein [Paenibacillus glycanilyticus]